MQNWVSIVDERGLCDLNPVVPALDVRVVALSGGETPLCSAVVEVEASTDGIALRERVGLAGLLRQTYDFLDEYLSGTFDNDVGE